MSASVVAISDFIFACVDSKTCVSWVRPTSGICTSGILVCGCVEVAGVCGCCCAGHGPDAVL